MKNELQRQLYKQFPKLFVQMSFQHTETCMCWGIETGNGWFDLIKETCKKIQDLIDIEQLPQIRFIQIKEKFGGLRIYCTGYNDKIEEIIEWADALSYTICERCGSTANHETKQTKGWIKTLCEKCRYEMSKGVKEYD